MSDNPKPRFPKSKISALVAIAVLIVFMAWQCVTWPVVEMNGYWVEEERIEADLASRHPVERPPMPAEMVFRDVTCAASLLLGVALMRVLLGTNGFIS